MLNQFNEQRRAVLEDLLALGNIAAEMGMTGERDVLQAAARRLEGNRFSLAVCGVLKNGKSTLINSLLGEAVLPMGVTPQTAVVTYLSYGAEKTCRVQFEDGRWQDISIDKIREYAVEEHNPDNEKGVKALYITYPLPLLKDGLVIIDTPGVGSIHPKHSQFTYEVLPYVDAVVFLLAVDQPLNISEVEFLQLLSQEERKTFFVLNKKDRYSPSEIEQSLNYITSVLKEQAGFDLVRAYILSARQGLKAKRENDQELLKVSGLKEFEEALGRFLEDERGAVAVTSALATARRSCRVLLAYIEREKAALESAGQELAEKIAALEQEIRKRQQEREKIRKQAQCEIKRITEELTFSLREQIRIVQAALNERQLKPENVYEALREQLNIWAQRSADVLKERLQGMTAQLLGEVRKADDELNWMFNRAFGLPIIVEENLTVAANKDEASEILSMLTFGLPPLFLIGGPAGLLLAAVGAFYGYHRHKEKTQAALRKQANAWLENTGHEVEGKVKELVLNAGAEIEAAVQRRYQSALDDLMVQVHNLKKAQSMSKEEAGNYLARLNNAFARVKAVQNRLAQ